MNKQMIEELRSIAAQEKNDMTTKAMVRLLAAGMIGTYDNVEVQTEKIAEIADCLNTVKEDVGAISGNVDQNTDDIEEIKKNLNSVVTNWAIVVGNWAKNHKKLTAAIIISVFVVVNLWLVSDFRKPILSNLFGLPWDLFGHLIETPTPPIP